MNQKQQSTTCTLYPVILPVSENDRQLRGRDKVQALSIRARQALFLSAEKSGAVLPDLPKNDKGVPLPINGIYWSITHKSDFVGAVVSRKKVGIDIEKFKPCSPGLFKKTASEEEWTLSGEDPNHLFFRYWTAKEAVIKTLGSGIKDLLTCKITHIPDLTHLVVQYKGDIFYIEHFFFNGHIASMVKNGCRIEWTRF